WGRGGHAGVSHGLPNGVEWMRIGIAAEADAVAAIISAGAKPVASITGPSAPAAAAATPAPRLLRPIRRPASSRPTMVVVAAQLAVTKAAVPADISRPPT